jgi:hypothetical protein
MLPRPATAPTISSGDVDDALDYLATLVKAWAASRTLNRCTARTVSFDHEPPTQRFARVLSSVENSAAEGFRDLSSNSHFADGDAFYELVALMICADDLAGDRCIDRRVVKVSTDVGVWIWCAVDQRRHVRRVQRRDALRRIDALQTRRW